MTIWERHTQRTCIGVPGRRYRLAPSTSSSSLSSNSTIVESRADACTKLCESRRRCWEYGAAIVRLGSAVTDRHFCTLRVGNSSQRCRLVHDGDYDTYRRAAVKPIPSPAEPETMVSVALCIVGVANHAMAPRAEKPELTHRPIFDNRTYLGMADWLSRLRRLGVRGRAFVVLDRSQGWVPNNGHSSHPHQANEASGGGSIAWRQQHGRTPMAVLEPALGALQARGEAFVEYWSTCIHPSVPDGSAHVTREAVSVSREGAASGGSSKPSIRSAWLGLKLRRRVRASAMTLLPGCAPTSLSHRRAPHPSSSQHTSRGRCSDGKSTRAHRPAAALGLHPGRDVSGSRTAASGRVIGMRWFIEMTLTGTST